VKTILLFLAGASAGVLVCTLVDARPQLVAGPFRPHPRPVPPPPAPPLPAPTPLNDDDSRLLGRLRPHLLQMAEERAQARVAAELTAAAQSLDGVKVTADGDVDEPAAAAGSVIAAFFASAVVALVKRVAVAIVSALILTCLVALFVKWWGVIIPAFTFLVSLVAVPAGWTAAKSAAPKKE
jgi:hypothetical protein